MVNKNCCIHATQFTKYTLEIGENVHEGLDMMQKCDVKSNVNQEWIASLSWKPEITYFKKLRIDFRIIKSINNVIRYAI